MNENCKKSKKSYNAIVISCFIAAKNIQNVVIFFGHFSKITILDDILVIFDEIFVIWRGQRPAKKLTFLL